MDKRVLELEQHRLDQVVQELQRQHSENEQLQQRAGSTVSSLNRDMWQEIGAVSIVNGLDQVAEFMSYMHQIKHSQKSLEFVNLLDRKYKTMLASPYFGRIDFKENQSKDDEDAERIYIGLGTLINQDHEFLIYDWRAPISSLYYDQEPGPVSYQSPEGPIQGDMSLKRQYKIKEGQLQYVFDASVTIGDEVLMEILSQSTQKNMRHIVNSIQQEQNAIIRSDDSHHLIVQGPAGSGKTSVALHRIAYLLYKYKDRLTVNDLLIFSPNEVFGDYIADVLPQLGESQVNQVTMTHFMHKLIGRKRPLETYLDMMETLHRHKHKKKTLQRKEGLRYKTSYLFLKDLEAYAEALGSLTPLFTDLIYKGQVLLDQKSLQAIYEEHRGVTPLLTRYERVNDRILFLLTPEVRSAISIENQLRETFQLDPLAFYLERFVPNDMEHSPLPYEDQAGYLYFLAKLGGLKHTERMKYVVIDEAQDYSIVQMKLLSEVFTHAKFTLTGDPLQAINPCLGPENYDGITQVFPESLTSRLSLKKTYRSTEEINALARWILKLGPEANTVGRSGQKPVILGFQNTDGILDHLKNCLPALLEGPYKTIAIITETIAETKALHNALAETLPICQITSDDDLYKPGLLVMPLFLAKGLEFDVVFIHNASQINYPSADDAWRLYTACTRALHELHVLYSGRLSPLLSQ